MRTTQSTASRRRALFATALGIAALAAPSAWAQPAWPAKPVTLVVGYPPGGQTDFAGRVLLASLQTSVGQPVVIDNKAGVNGNLAAVEVMKAPADGHKLLVGNGSMTISAHVYTNIGLVDPRQLTPIGMMLQSALVLAVPASSPVKTYADFAELVKARSKAGKSIDYGTGGVGALPHVTMELLRERLGNAAMNHVPYKGSSPAMTDLIAGRLDAMFDATSVIAPFIKSGQLRPLLVTSAKRVPAFPDVPTAAEAGLKDFEVLSFVGLYGPPNLPADIVKKANAALNTALKDPAITKGIFDRGDEPGGGTPEQLGALTRTQFKTWGDVVKANNIRAD
ncbi:tripartite tricarboxylate transporter substrate binding protein [Variovorax guangxiensis]|uniref:Bug family tripartite tricarboxylate transporter substrate binding protein n=1 Tax=Variovorax guangxiensis TaxID=1775474 RepID=UPI00285AE679|nr:tripartite tricarboxylate transporter substrate binding protein [Variovorax guangxiensis]MDR6861588.1 tripartite-type tricarboxylate transporter receptor subunit TctC [Variovorax guangxiensis]